MRTNSIFIKLILDHLRHNTFAIDVKKPGRIHVVSRARLLIPLP